MFQRNPSLIAKLRFYFDIAKVFTSYFLKLAIETRQTDSYASSSCESVLPHGQTHPSPQANSPIGLGITTPTLRF